MNEVEKIRICSCHEEQVPLIWTFAFNGSEYWCPACGFNGGMLGSGTMVESTKELKNSLETWKKKAEEFLNAKSAFVCCEMEFEGKRIKPIDLPDSEKIRLRRIVNEWEYQINSH
jgi:hypothetical protein